MSQCTKCNQKPGEFICLNSECVKKNKNNAFCNECFWELDQQHQPKKIQDVQQQAEENSKKQIQIFEQIIQTNIRDLNQLEDFLESQKQTYIQWHDKQKKSICQLIEQQNFLLQSKFQEIQFVLEKQNLDSIINYCLINLDQQQEQYNQVYKQQDFERQLQIEDIQARISFIKDLQFSISDLSNFFFEQPKSSILKTKEKSTVNYQQCKDHEKPEKYLCVHQDCIQQKCFPFYCKKCYKNIHKQHDFKTYAKNYMDIKKEQDEKTQLINNEQENIKSQIQQQFNKNCELIQKRRYETMKKYELIKNNMLTIKNQSIDHLNKLIQFTFTQYNINTSLLSKTIDEIKQEYSIEYKSFQQKMSLSLQKEPQEIRPFTAQLDRIYEKEQQDIRLLHQNLKSKNEEINNLTNKLQLSEKLNSQYQICFYQLYPLQNSHKIIQQQTDELVTNIKEKMMNSIYLSIGDKQFFKSFDTNFKDIKTQITAAQDKIEKIINEYIQISNNKGKQIQNNSQVNQKETINEVNNLKQLTYHKKAFDPQIYLKKVPQQGQNNKGALQMLSSTMKSSETEQIGINQLLQSSRIKYIKKEDGN